MVFLQVWPCVAMRFITRPRPVSLAVRHRVAVRHLAVGGCHSNAGRSMDGRPQRCGAAQSAVHGPGAVAVRASGWAFRRSAVTGGLKVIGSKKARKDQTTCWVEVDGSHGPVAEGLVASPHLSRSNSVARL